MADALARVGDYLIDSELPSRPGERVFVSTHAVLPRRARIVVLPADRTFELACLLETIRHPAVPRVYECGRLADRRPWLAVAVVDGVTLASRLAQGALVVRETVEMVRDLAAILAHAHGNGIVHGALSSHQVSSTRMGWAIVDWSEASLAHDHAVDVQALGAVAYAALARCLPSMPIARRCPNVPSAVARLVDGMLDSTPTAARVRDDAARLCEDMLLYPDDGDDYAEISIEEDEVSISVEDIILLENPRHPPPIPARVRAKGTGPVVVGRLDKESS